nr:hypothetical protein [Ruminiclostridium sp.]
GTTESKNILDAAGDVLEFSDMTAKIYKYDYDGQFLRLLVGAEYRDQLSETNDNHQLYINVKDSGNYDVGEYCLNDYKYVTHKDWEDITEILHLGNNGDDLRFDTLMYDLGIYIRPEPGQTAELRFEYHPAAEGAEKEYAGSYTLTGLDTTDLLRTVTNSSADTSVTVSRRGALIESPYDYGQVSELSLAVRYKDGTEQILADRETKPEAYPTNDIPYFEFPAYYTELGRGRDYLLNTAFQGNLIDVANISCVVLNGEEVPVVSAETADTTESKNILDAAGDVIEFGTYTATIDKVDFDGTFLRVFYTVSDYEDSFADPNEALMLIGTPYDNAYAADHIVYSGGSAYDIAYDESFINPESRTNRAIAHIRLDKGETAVLNFFDSVHAGSSSGKTSENYILTGIGAEEYSRTVYDIGDIRRLQLSPFGAVITSHENYIRDPHFSFELIYSDGNRVNIYPENGEAHSSSGEQITELFGLDVGEMMTEFISPMPGPIPVNAVSAVVINGEEIPLYFDADAERETDIKAEIHEAEKTGPYELLYFIDGEPQPELTETLDMSEDFRIDRHIKGRGVHRYRIDVINTVTGAQGTLLDIDVDFRYEPPLKHIADGMFDPGIFRKLNGSDGPPAAESPEPEIEAQ